MTALEVFRKVASEFNAMTDNEVQDWMELSSPFVSQKRFANLYPQALAYYTAHMIKTNQGDNDGMLIREKEGDLEKQYMDMSQNIKVANIYLMRSQYGQMFMTLSKRRGLPGVTRMGTEIEALYNG